MALKNSKLLPIKVVFTFLLLFAQIQTNCGQKLIVPDSIFTKLFDADLREITFKNINHKKPIILITPTNCSGCVKYFTKSKNNYSYIFILYSESLLEAEQTKNRFGLGNKNVYFTTNEYYKCKLINNCEKPTPNCIYETQKKVYFLNYKSIDSLSKAFGLNHEKLKTQLEQMYPSKVNENSIK